MASDESIGSCSLDVDATASDISECVDAGTVSARTLCSLPLSARTPDPDISVKSPGGASTPEYVKRTARLFESPDGSSAGNLPSKSNGKHKSSEVPNVVVVNGNSSTKAEENLLNGDSYTGKKPSYLGLACSISGYSGITTYDSKLREGFRSRDHSPGRISIIKSRDVSPLRPGSDQAENFSTPAYKSECGNFLVAPSTKSSGVGGRSADKGGVISPNKSKSDIVESSGNGLDAGIGTSVSHVNGDGEVGTSKNRIESLESERTMGDEGRSVHQTVNGVSKATGDSNGGPYGSSRYVDNYIGSTKEEFFSNSSSTIRESTRHFMSSMLTTDSSYSSTHYESSTTKSRDATDFSSPLKNSPLTSVPRDGFGAYSPIKRSPESPKTGFRDSPGSRVTSSPRDSSNFSSPLKHSPESPKTSSKDSLTPPVTTSPQKRSPGAVRVVEFTSQTKSYVRTAFMSGNSMESSSPYTSQGYTESSQSKSFGDGTQSSSYLRSVRPGLSDGDGRSESPSTQANGSSSETVTWSTKSFIQQRVERLYGPGALAQGFFRRVRHKPPDDVQGPSEGAVAQNGHHSNNGPSLPVLRHLRPEFRAQLSLGSTTRKLQGCEETSSIEQSAVKDVTKRTSVEVIPLQQQISVESLTESLTDLQPAAPEVVLPIDQSQSVTSQTAEKSEIASGALSSTQEKDGHYFLKLLKQEIDRLNGLVEASEADLTSGELLPEEALGKLRAASGQAKLLIRQKLQQFEGLCHKNIAQSSEEPFPTTSEDLAGFWDMVMLQVEHVNSLFEEITKLKANNWVEDKVPSKTSVEGAPKRKPGSGTKRSSAAPSKPSATSEAARKAREEARRKMMEERRKAMKEKRDAAESSNQVEIFVPQENGECSDNNTMLSSPLAEQEKLLTNILEEASNKTSKHKLTSSLSDILDYDDDSDRDKTYIPDSESESSLDDNTMNSRPIKIPVNKRMKVPLSSLNQQEQSVKTVSADITVK